MPSSKPIDVPCVILCGGKSQRMGRDKSLLPFGGVTLIEWMFDKFRALFSSTVLCGKQTYFHLPTILDAPAPLDTPAPLHCPLLGLKSAFEALGDAEWIFFASVDTPFIPQDSILALFYHLQNHKDAQIVHFSTPLHTHYLNAFFHKSTLEILNHHLSRQIYALHEVYKNCHCASLSAADEGVFCNLNTLEIYENAKRSLNG